MKKRLLGVALAAALLLTACGGGSDQPNPGSEAEPEGEITVLTNRTDIVDSVFTAKYVPEFKKLYPKVDVKFEAITDYEGQVKIRLNTKDYGDVLLIPAAVKADQYPSFFESLGAQEEMSQKYRWTPNSSFEGQTYGIATFGNANGIVYNKKVWADAGVTEFPKTPEEFQTALGQIKSTTKAIPLYTNYAAGWPLTTFGSYAADITGSPEAINQLATIDDPWGPGQVRDIANSLLFDAVANKNTEPDPTTTDWEKSKGLLGSGQIATMALGSWAIVQMQGEAKNPDDIGFMPFPAQADGKFHSTSGPDLINAVNVNSEKKAAARAWIEWFTEKSGFDKQNGAISAMANSELPKSLEQFAANGVELVELAPPPAGKESLVKDIDKEAEIATDQPGVYQNMIDVARGAKPGTKQEIFDSLNTKWAKARSELGG